MIKKAWFIKKNSKSINDKRINELLIPILLNRQIDTDSKIDLFINPSLEKIYDPFLMKDMNKGVEKIKEAIKEKKLITIISDYDCDGVTSTVILYKTLKSLGANVNFYIPDRKSEGYGIRSERIRILHEQGTEVIITCDNGISQMEAMEVAKELEIPVIITDHHELAFEKINGVKKYILPNAHAIINAKQKDCMYPFKEMCGAGVVFLFSQALYSKFNIKMEEKLYKELLQLATIGTICDVVNLVDVNRIIAKNGLSLMKDTSIIGLKALIKATELENKDITCFMIGFILGPCINSCGRITEAMDAVNLLLTNDIAQANELAINLKNTNDKRKEMTEDGVNKVIKNIETNSLDKNKVLVVYENSIDESIVGIVAGRIREKYNLPTIVLTNSSNDGIIKGSGRSIDEYNMFEELNKCKKLMENFGGHPMAAGLSLKYKNLHLLIKELNSNTDLTDKDVIPKVHIDIPLSFKDISFKLIDDLNELAPFGKGNATPVLAQKNLEVTNIFLMGKEKNHIKITCKNNMIKLPAVGFNKTNEFKELLREKYTDIEIEEILKNNQRGLKIDLIFFPSINEYKGEKKVQLMIKDIRLSK